MTTMTMAKALNAGLRRAMGAEPKVLLAGEDIGKLGGVFRVTEGLQAEFGPDRVVDSPLAESGIVGTAINFAPVAKQNDLASVTPMRRPVNEPGPIETATPCMSRGEIPSSWQDCWIRGRIIAAFCRPWAKLFSATIVPSSQKAIDPCLELVSIASNMRTDHTERQPSGQSRLSRRCASVGSLR